MTIFSFIGSTGMYSPSNDSGPAASVDVAAHQSGMAMIVKGAA